MAGKKSAALPGKPRAKNPVPDAVAAAFVGGGVATAAPATAKSVGRPKTGKRSNPDYARLTAWVPTEVLEALKIEALKRKCDIGDLIMKRMDFTDIEIP